MTAPVQLHRRSFGAGSREVLAIHCTLSHSGAWRGMAEAYPERWRITAPDLPSHGKSNDWDGVSDYLAQCVEALSEHLAAPVDLVGHSFGAVVALALAQKHPERIRRLCLFEPVLFAACGLDRPDLLAEYRAQSAPLVEAFARDDLETAARLFNRVWGDGRRWEDISRRTRDYMTTRMPVVDCQDAVLFGDTGGLLKPEALARVTMPVLLMQGSQSPSVVRAITRALITRLPRAAGMEIEGVGHMGPITHPKVVAAALDDFVEVAEEEVDVLFGDGPVADQPRRK